MIVDDEMLARIGIQSMLDGVDEIKVEQIFASGEEALEYLKIHPIDILITDIEMSGMEGLELIHELRKFNSEIGIIILSCHDNFQYAQEAIEVGADSYQLKHEISPEALCQEISLIYKKKAKTSKRMETVKKNFHSEIYEDRIYTIGVLRLLGEDIKAETIADRTIDKSMVIYLFEELVSKYSMGTLMAPLKRDIFIIFQFDKELSETEREEKLSLHLAHLKKHVEQYMNQHLIIGVSREFNRLNEIPSCYKEALQAMNLSFYRDSEFIFKGEIAESNTIPTIQFSSDGFLDDDGIELFEIELTEFLKQCERKRIDSEIVKQMFIQEISVLMYKILYAYRLDKEITQKWSPQYKYVPIIMKAENVFVLKNELLTIMKQLREDLLYQLRKDEMNSALQFIYENLESKLSLADIATMNCMSIPSFCKKFKERTGKTFIQYVNEQKIARVKKYLMNRNYSLGEIAEMTGFSNENYMIRVFKKITGTTIKDYRNELN